MAGTTHMAGGAGPGGAAEPEDDDAEDDEEGPGGGARGAEDEELEEASGAPGMFADKPAATRARAESTPASMLAFHSAVNVFLKDGLKARH